MHLQIKVKRPPRYLEDGGDDSINLMVDQILHAIEGRGQNDQVDGVTVDVDGDGVRLVPLTHGDQLFEMDPVVDAIIEHLKSWPGGLFDPYREDAHPEFVDSLAELPAALEKYLSPAGGSPYEIRSLVILKERRKPDGKLIVSVGLDREYVEP